MSRGAGCFRQPRSLAFTIPPRGDIDPGATHPRAWSRITLGDTSESAAEEAVNTGGAAAARRVPEQVLLLAALVLAGGTLAIALSPAWQASSAESPIAALLLLGISLLATLLLVWAARALRRQHMQLRLLARQVSSDLESGTWQDAVRSLRDDRLGAPSAFDALATGFEEVLGESDRRWQTLADLAADWYWETDAEHRLAWMSGAGPLVRMRGLTPAELIGRRHDEVAAFEAPTDGWPSFHALLDQGRPFRDLEFRVRPTGTDEATVWVAVSGRPRRDTQGRVIGYEGVGRDISERKRALERLRSSETRWTLMAGLASDYYWETDAEHRMQPLRPEVARRFGRLAEHIEGRTPWEAYPQAMAAAQWREHREDVAARRPFQGVEMEIDLGDGRHRIVALSGIPRFDGKGGFLGYHGIGRDVTLRREAERLLMRHNESLQQAVAQRTEALERLNGDLEAFARELAHELRAPIGHVQGLAHLLVSKAGDRLTPEEMQLLGLQLSAARQMRETLDALLDLARSTAQPMAFEDVDLSALALDVIAGLPELQRAAPVTWDIQPGIRVRGSPQALRIVLVNLLGNAAKFTRQVAQPQVRLGARATNDGHVRLQVVDNGAGFPAEHADRLFRPFGRLHGHEIFHGTGIGLTIVQRIVERHGGRVGAHGAVGQGASFDVTLPGVETAEG